jgi:hypothetical protein
VGKKTPSSVTIGVAVELIWIKRQRRVSSTVANHVPDWRRRGLTRLEDKSQRTING